MQLEVLFGFGALLGDGLRLGSGRALLAQCVGTWRMDTGDMELTVSFASGVQMGIRRYLLADATC